MSEEFLGYQGLCRDTGEGGGARHDRYLARCCFGRFRGERLDAVGAEDLVHRIEQMAHPLIRQVIDHRLAFAPACDHTRLAQHTDMGRRLVDVELLFDFACGIFPLTKEARDQQPLRAVTRSR